MLEKYYETPLGGNDDEHQRLIAVTAAIDLIKSAVSTEAGPRNFDYELKQLSALIGPIADSIQTAIADK